MNGVFDRRQVRRGFGRAASGYLQAAALQQQVQADLLERLDYRDDPALGLPPPQVIVDAGCGPALAAAAMKRRWPRAQVLALDIALPMLRQARAQSTWWRPLQRVAADIRALPLADASVDLLFSNLCLQWVDDLPATFAGFRRVMKPGGLLLLSTFGSETLEELRYAFAQADAAAAHVSPFVDIATFGDALLAAGFRDPVLDRDRHRRDVDDLAALMRQLKGMGATNALQTRRHTLTGPRRFARAEAAYAAMRQPDGRLPVTWDVISAMAWAPVPGQPIRHGRLDEVRIPASGIPVRRRRA